MGRPILTDLQRQTLSRVAMAQAADAWYRAGSSGERVTLASLHTRGLLDRRAWRGVEGERDAAHEYRLHERLAELVPLAKAKLDWQRAQRESGRQRHG